MLCNHVSASTDGLCYWRSKTRGVTRVKNYRFLNGFRNWALASIRRVERLGDYLVPSCVLHWLIFRQPCHRTCIFCLLGVKRKGISWNPKLFRVLSVGLSRGGGLADVQQGRNTWHFTPPTSYLTVPTPHPVTAGSFHTRDLLGSSVSNLTFILVLPCRFASFETRPVHASGFT